MRKALVSALLKKCDDPTMCFLTGDLGFMSLEPLRDVLGARFLNTGVAEQNMISVAAGLAREGMHPWVYSIAPFCYARPFEQIRNDICLHDLPVRLIGNGAGYGYGVQGPTHHGIEDCAAMGCLQNMRVYAPAFDDDLLPLVTLLSEADKHPGYLRLGLDERPAGMIPQAYAPFRLLCNGHSGLILALGTLSGSIWSAVLELPEGMRPTLWCCSCMPRTTEDYPEEILQQAVECPWVLVVEEHVATGGLGSSFALSLLKSGRQPKHFVHRHALGYPSSLYGSQQYHRIECGLDKSSVLRLIQKLNRFS